MMSNAASPNYRLLKKAPHLPRPKKVRMQMRIAKAVKNYMLPMTGAASEKRKTAAEPVMDQLLSRVVVSMVFKNPPRQ
jgi:hypothetical protein